MLQVTAHRLYLRRMPVSEDTQPARGMESDGAVWCCLLRRRGEELGLEELLGLMGHACSGIKHMHDQGIAHLDIKPHNLLVFREGRRRVLKVADYGLSRRMVDPDSGMIDAGGQWWCAPACCSAPACL